MPRGVKDSGHAFLNVAIKSNLRSSLSRKNSGFLLADVSQLGFKGAPFGAGHVRKNVVFVEHDERAYKFAAADTS